MKLFRSVLAEPFKQINLTKEAAFFPLNEECVPEDEQDRK